MQFFDKGMATRQFSKREAIAFDTHQLRGDDFISKRIFKNPVLVNPRFVWEGIATNNRLVFRNWNTRVTRDQLRSVDGFIKDNRTFNLEIVFTDIESNRYFFKCRIAGPLPDPINGSFDTTGTIFNSSEAIRHGHS